MALFILDGTVCYGGESHGFFLPRDAGDDGGDAGGEVIVQGTPEQVAGDEKSYTGAFLKSRLIH